MQRTMRRILVTGGAGFIGSNLVRLLLSERDDVEVFNLDFLTYAGNLANLGDLERDPRYTFIKGDVCDPDTVRGALEGVAAVMHLAAETHVDRSIHAGAPFVRTNVLGTHALLAAALEAGVERFLHCSTDEVYGELPWRDPDAPGARERFTEDTPLEPRSPYSASKAGSDHLALAFHRTFGLDVVVTRCSNNYGPYQFPEKLIPLCVTNALEDRTLPVYGDGLNVRDWIHVDDHCRGMLSALEGGARGGSTTSAGTPSEPISRWWGGSYRPSGRARRRSSSSGTGPGTTGATQWIPPALGRSSDGRLGSASNRGWTPPSRGTGPVRNGGARSRRGSIVDTMTSNTVDRARSLRGRLEVLREARQGVAAPPPVGIFGLPPWAT